MSRTSLAATEALTQAHHKQSTTLGVSSSARPKSKRMSCSWALTSSTDLPAVSTWSLCSIKIAMWAARLETHHSMGGPVLCEPCLVSATASSQDPACHGSQDPKCTLQQRAGLLS